MSYPEQIGFDKGLQKGLVQGIRLGLNVKFGTEGLALMPLVEAQEDLALLQKVIDTIDQTNSLDEVRRLLPSTETA
jgi:hypothetical protein